jgi:hypothetical protein
MAMADKPFVPSDTTPATHYELPLKAYKDLCLVRDELRLFAAVSARRGAVKPEMLVCRNTLAHCFDHLAQRVEDIVKLFGETPEQPAANPHLRRTVFKR